MIHFVILFSRQGKIRLQKWYEARPEKDKKKVTRELTSLVLSRKPKMCNFLEWKDLKIVYKRYASLFFLFAIDKDVRTRGIKNSGDKAFSLVPNSLTLSQFHLVGGTPVIQYISQDRVGKILLKCI